MLVSFDIEVSTFNLDNFSKQNEQKRAILQRKKIGQKILSQKESFDRTSIFRVEKGGQLRQFGQVGAQVVFLFIDENSTSVGVT